jgi:hypothetical protein
MDGRNIEQWLVVQPRRRIIRQWLATLGLVPRPGRNPKTGIEVPILPRRVIVFKP